MNIVDMGLLLAKDTDVSRISGWGNNTNYIFGEEPNALLKTTKKIIDFDKPIQDLRCGRKHVITHIGDKFDTPGALYSWGNNEYGQLGSSDKINRSNPYIIDFPTLYSDNLAMKINIAAGGTHSVISNGYTVYGCGNNADNQLGNTSIDSVSEWILIHTANDDYVITRIGAGDSFTYWVEYKSPYFRIWAVGRLGATTYNTPTCIQSNIELISEIVDFTEGFICLKYHEGYQSRYISHKFGIFENWITSAFAQLGNFMSIISISEDAIYYTKRLDFPNDRTYGSYSVDQVFSIGPNNFGSCGTGDNISVETGINLNIAGMGNSQVLTYGEYNIINGNNGIFVCGRNDNYQLGTNDNQDIYNLLNKISNSIDAPSFLCAGEDFVLVGYNN